MEICELSSIIPLRDPTEVVLLSQLTFRMKAPPTTTSNSCDSERHVTCPRYLLLVGCELLVAPLQIRESFPHLLLHLLVLGNLRREKRTVLACSARFRLGLFVHRIRCHFGKCPSTISSARAQPATHPRPNKDQNLSSVRGGGRA